MTPFEYVTVLISIILGLGVTQLVTGVADIVHQWERVKMYWPHLLWIVFVFFLHVQEWWLIYDLKRFQSWELATFLFVVLYPINLFILARILFPFGSSASGTNFKDFYFSNYRKFFLWAVVLVVLSILEDLLVFGYTILEQPIQLGLLVILSFLVYKKYEAEWLHKLVVVLLCLLLLGNILYINPIGPPVN